MEVHGDYEWDEQKAQENIHKHHLSFDEAVEVFDDPYYIERYDEKHSTDKETRYNVIGRIKRQVVVLVVHTPRGERTRIISAYYAEKKEIDAYAKQFR